MREGGLLLTPGGGMRFWTHLLTSGTSGVVVGGAGGGGGWRRWSRRAGAVPWGAEPGLSPPPLWCLSRGGVTKSSRSPLLSSSVQPERKGVGAGGAPPRRRGRELGLRTPCSQRSPHSTPSGWRALRDHRATLPPPPFL